MCVVKGRPFRGNMCSVNPEKSLAAYSKNNLDRFEGEMLPNLTAH